MNQFMTLLSEHQTQLEQHYGRLMNQDIRRAINDMLHCKTDANRASHWYCGHCQHNQQLPLSCGNRNCNQCQHQTTKTWLARQEAKLLPVHYFMVTFTLPSQLRSLTSTHPKVLYQMMFKVTAALLKDFASRQDRGELGFTSVLHTHNRQRDSHPHLHIIVPSGRYDATRKQWHKVDQDYLFNAFALAKVWRARMLEAINQSDVMTMPDNVPNKWVVDCRKVGFGLPAFKYLSRYLYRDVLPDSDIVNITESHVTFRYKQGGNNEIKTRTLPTLSFLWLILLHVLPKGLQRVRDYGFLRGNAKKLRLQILLKLDIQQAAQALIAVVKKPVVYLCPCCQHAMKVTGTSRLI